MYKYSHAITLVENAINEGKMSSLHGIQQMGYWYNPSTGASIEVSWADGQHHSDKVIRNYRLFGFSKKINPDYFFEREMGDINSEVIQKFGWVRISVSQDRDISSGTHASIESKSLRDMHKALTWLVKDYPEIYEATIEFVDGPCVCLNDADLEWFLKKGKLPKGIQF